MTAYMKIAGIEGEAKEQEHDGWIVVDSMTAPIHRTIPQGAKGTARRRGETVLGDVLAVRELDKSSVKLAEACANGTLYDEVQIDFCNQADNKQVTYLTYTLRNVIVTGYNLHANANGGHQPSEEVSFSFEEVEWTYNVLDDKGGSKGKVAGKFNPALGKA